MTVTMIAIIADAGGAWSLIARTGSVKTKSEDPTPTEVPRPFAAPMYHCRGGEISAAREKRI